MTKPPAPLHELSITRPIDAAPESVYRVETERLCEWWPPYTTPVVELDLRPGGRGRTVTQGPEPSDGPE